MFKLIYYMIRIPFEIVFLPFRIIGAFIPKTTRTYKSTFDKEADLWGLSKEDRKIAKQERMSPADYIEAEERNDDNLDYDD